MVNKVVLIGTLAEEFQFSHTCKEENFLKSAIKIKRNSGTEDIIPLIVNKKLLPDEEGWYGEKIWLSGTIKSYHKNPALPLFVFVNEMLRLDFNVPDFNEVSVIGLMTNRRSHRVTPMGKEIFDFVIKSERTNQRFDYIPCIIFGKDAVNAMKFDPGSRVWIKGKIQSREYFKKMPEGHSERKTACEVSCYSLKEDKTENEKDNH